MSVHSPQSVPGILDVYLPNQKWIHRSVLAPSPSTQALLPETDGHIYSRTHADRGPVTGNADSLEQG